MRDLIEARGMSWHYWELASSFGVYDPSGAGAFRTDLRDALYGR
jgi:endoglucanase